MKAIASLLFIVLILLQLNLWLGSYGLLRLWGLQHDVEEQRDENKQLLIRNETLHAEVVELKEGKEALEERARSQLGMIKDGEVFYRVVPKQTKQKAVEKAPLNESQASE